MFASNTKNFATVLLIVFAATFLLCAWSNDVIAMNEPMNDCATQQNQVALCSKNPQSHLLAWRNFLPVSPQKMPSFLLSALLLAVGFFVNRKRLDSRLFVEQYSCTVIRRGLSIVDPIRRALSRGIIQPQIYELAIG